MPTTTRRTASRNGPVKGAQSTLTFGKGRVTKNTALVGKNKLHKSNSVSDISEAKVDSPKVVDIESDNVTDSQVSKEHTKVLKSEVIRAPEIVVDTLTPEEKRASGVNQKEVIKYWQAKEKERLAPRVHQDEVSTEEKILRLFDMSSQYGPCIGISRRKRWMRAHKLGLQPPIEVLAVVIKEDGKGTKNVERAHLEELLASKVGTGDLN